MSNAELQAALDAANATITEQGAKLAEQASEIGDLRVALDAANATVLELRSQPTAAAPAPVVPKGPGGIHTTFRGGQTAEIHEGPAADEARAKLKGETPDLPTA